MPERPVVSREEWLRARRELLAREKEFTRQRDALSRERQALPWVKVETPYTFTGKDGEVSLRDLFGPHGQLVVYHFMFGPDWEQGCPSCSFWADNFNGVDVHLAHRDVALVAISRAPYDKLATYRERMGWSFEWVSSEASSFNFDFGVSFTEAQREGEAEYNYGLRKVGEELPGISVFVREGADIFHTYSAYSRGLDMMNGAYHYLDLVPKGRDEAELPWSMAWLRRRDQYED